MLRVGGGSAPPTESEDILVVREISLRAPVRQEDEYFAKAYMDCSWRAQRTRDFRSLAHAPHGGACADGLIEGDAANRVMLTQ